MAGCSDNMYELVYSQENMFFISFFLGVMMGVTYDVLRGLRRVFSHNIFYICVEDIIYWFAWTIVLIYAVQTYNSGIIRIYIFLAILIGLLIYLLTISRLYIFILLKIISIIKKFVVKLNILLKYVVKRVRIILTVKKYRKTSGDR